MIGRALFFAVIAVNIFFLAAAAFRLLRNRHMINFLVAMAVAALAVLEAGKAALLSGAAFSGRLLDVGLFFTVLLWLAAGIPFLPSGKFSFNKIIITPLLACASLGFFLWWWVKPFTIMGAGAGVVGLSPAAQYLFVLVVFDLAVVLYSLERGFYFLRQPGVRRLFWAALMLLGPYIILAAYAVFFSGINNAFLLYSSLSVLPGAVLLFFAARGGFSGDPAGEGTGVQTSMILFLVGGYLFFVGAFIKLFKLFGWNLNSLLSFSTALLVFFAAIVLIFSASLKERVRTFIWRSFSRQRHDWQKIWEDFTYRIAALTNIDKVREEVSAYIAAVMEVERVTVVFFGAAAPLEPEFCDWMLRRAEAFSAREISGDGSFARYPAAREYFKNTAREIISPLYNDKRIIGFIGFNMGRTRFLDKELLKLLSLQASGALINAAANQALREAERKESIYKLSSFVVHDVKNYINNLALLARNRDKFDNAEFQKDALYTLEHTMQKMQRLIDEFNSLRKDLVLEKQGCSLDELTREALLMTAKDKLSGIEVSVSVDKALKVMVDRHHMERVLFNLILNAAEAVTVPGRIAITGGRQASGAVYWSVRDSGRGMTREFIEKRLFRPFSSTKEKGMGIGLYQCKTIVEAHGGKIEVKSEEGKGTEVIIVL